MTTRTLLENAVADFLIRDDVASDPVNFTHCLNMAEATLNRRLRSLAQERTLELVITGREAPISATSMEIRSVYVTDTGRPIEYRAPEALRASPAWDGAVPGLYYTIEGRDSSTAPYHIILAAPATEDNPLNISVNHMTRWQLGDASTDSNWLLMNHFDVYLYAVAAKAADFTGQSEKEVKYSMLLDRAVDELRQSETRKRFSASTKRQFLNRTVV